MLRDVLDLDFTQLDSGNTRIESSKLQQAYLFAMGLDLPEEFWLKLGFSFIVYNYHLDLSNWILTAKNVTDILPKLADLYGKRAVAFDEYTDADNSKWIIQPIGYKSSKPLKFKPIIELSAATLVRSYETLLGIPELELKFFFEYPEPAYASVYREVLGPHIVFDAAKTEVHVPKQYLHQSFLNSDPLMHEYYDEQLIDWFNPSIVKDPLIEKVELALLKCDDKFPSLNEVSEQYLCLLNGIFRRRYNPVY